AVGRFLEPRADLFGYGPLDPGGNAGEEGSRRNARPLQHHAPGAHQRFLAEDAPVEEDRSHADEAAILDPRAVQDDAVSHGDLLAHLDRRAAAGEVENAGVLDVAAPPDTD